MDRKTDVEPQNAETPEDDAPDISAPRAGEVESEPSAATARGSDHVAAYVDEPEALGADAANAPAYVDEAGVADADADASDAYDKVETVDVESVEGDTSEAPEVDTNDLSELALATDEDGQELNDGSLEETVSGDDDTPVMLGDTVPHTPPSREGYLDQVEEGGWAAGWARWHARGAKIELDVYIDDVFIERIVADQYREDLQQLYNEPNIAFWFGIPEALLDGDDHRIDVRYADTGESIDGSPQSFSIATLRAGGTADTYNLIPNAGFQRWPGGLSVKPTKRFEEVAEGWYFDARKGTTPAVHFRPERPSDLALADEGYAMNVSVADGGNEGFMRLIVPIDTTHAGRDLFFSLGIRRPVHAANDATHVTEIFLANARDGVVERIKPLRKNIRPRGTQRMLNIPLGVRLSELGAGVVPAIVIDFRGDGDMTLFSPVLANAPRAVGQRQDTIGTFEDSAIRSQVGTLMLAPIWQDGAVVTTIREPGRPPQAIAQVEPSPTLPAIPFIQVVIPVFNAGLDVEECLRAIIESTDTPFEALLFDDGSEDYVVSRVDAWTRMDPRIRYVRQRSNVGYTSNVNIGLQSAVSDFAVLLNSDTIVTPGWLRKLYEIICTDDRVAAVGPVSNAASWQSIPFTKASSGDWIVNAFGDEHPPHVINTMLESLDDGTAPAFPLLNGFCTLFRRSALAEIGYFDDASFPRGYGEENDLCIRLGKAGYELRVAINTYVHHKKSRSFGHVQRKDLSKKANGILRGKYPEIDFGKLEERMRTEPAINTVRLRLRDLLRVEPA